MKNRLRVENFGTMEEAFGRVGVTRENMEDVADRSKVADFFPKKDIEAIRALVRENLRLLKGEGNPTTMLWPSYASEHIDQTHFGISESVPLTLYGAVPCIGVGFYNSEKKRAMFTHIEAREDGDEGNREAARILVAQMADLFREQPGVILFQSMLLGIFEYHQDIMQEVRSRFATNRIIKNSTSHISLDPVTGCLKAWDCYSGSSSEIVLK